MIIPIETKQYEQIPKGIPHFKVVTKVYDRLFVESSDVKSNDGFRPTHITSELILMPSETTISNAFVKLSRDKKLLIQKEFTYKTFIIENGKAPKYPDLTRIYASEFSKQYFNVQRFYETVEQKKTAMEKFSIIPASTVLKDALPSEQYLALFVDVDLEELNADVNKYLEDIQFTVENLSNSLGVFYNLVAMSSVAHIAPGNFQRQFKFLKENPANSADFLGFIKKVLEAE